MPSIEITVDIETHNDVNGDAEELGEQFASEIEKLLFRDSKGDANDSFATWIYELTTTVEVLED